MMPVNIFEHPLHADIVIVGAGHAGAHAAIALRQRDRTDSVTILGDEPDAPYARPPLSKDYLSGEREPARLALRPDTFWEEKRVELRLNCAVTEILPSDHLVRLADGRLVRYGRLIWAAGGRARRLGVPGEELSGVFTLRNRSDADRLRERLPKARHALVVGGGYVGLEAATVLVKRGISVTVIEAQDRVLARVAGTDIAEYIAALHRRHGVDIRFRTSLTRLSGENGSVSSATLSDGVRLDCDIVVVGIGIIPNVECLEAAGATCRNGVLIDKFCRTSLPDVYAIGDCAAHTSRWAGGGLTRLESIQNATDMATTVAQDIVGCREEYCALPWFWSHQYDVKLQTVGVSTGHDSAVVRGGVESGSFSVVYLRDGRVIALDCVNAPRDFLQGKALVQAGARVSSTRLADIEEPLKNMAAA